MSSIDYVVDKIKRLQLNSRFLLEHGRRGRSKKR